VHLHILGVCGTFMGGIAAIAQQAGFRVTGCDANVYPPMSEQLKALGIELIEGYGADQLRLAPDLWVVGNVVTRGNPLMEAVLDRGDRYVSGPQWLAEHFLARKWGTGCCGNPRQDDCFLDACVDFAGHRARSRLPYRGHCA
jgi:UDP-N-acetylmuramate: L-alanyl-gamma-D-glutamyl-meso-diaminopimelate ligase